MGTSDIPSLLTFFSVFCFGNTRPLILLSFIASAFRKPINRNTKKNEIKLMIFYIFFSFFFIPCEASNEVPNPTARGEALAIYGKSNMLNMEGGGGEEKRGGEGGEGRGGQGRTGEERREEEGRRERERGRGVRRGGGEGSEEGRRGGGEEGRRGGGEEGRRGGGEEGRRGGGQEGRRAGGQEEMRGVRGTRRGYFHHTPKTRYQEAREDDEEAQFLPLHWPVVFISLLDHGYILRREKR